MKHIASYSKSSNFTNQLFILQINDYIQIGKLNYIFLPL